MMDPAALRLYLVADPDHVAGDVVAEVASAIAGGVSMVQLRAKSLSDRKHLVLALTMCDLCRDKGIPFIVNDRLDIALAANASGVHLGVDDLPLHAARSLASQDFIIGYSPETDAQVRSAASEGADYLGIGPVFGTRTKDDAGDALGLREFARRTTLSPLPVVGIGGINASGVAGVVRAGAIGVAVVSAILGAPDPGAATRNLRGIVDAAVQDRGLPTR
jgi:thiamine-phosphate pyrophosphorylase